MDHAAIVNRQIEAYEQGDIEAFIATYDEAAVCTDLGSAKVIATGKAEIKKVWGRLFDQGRRRVGIRQRIVQGDFVVDHESVLIERTGETVNTVAIYDIRAGLIRNVWFAN